jgi:hypothetical protein
MCEDDTIQLDVVADVDHVDINIDSNKEEDDRTVSFKATVMAAVIAEAAANDDEDQFIAASFSQL